MRNLHKKARHGATEIDFVTCGIELRGELLQRASKGLLEFEELPATPGYGEDALVVVVTRLIRVYVRCQQIIFRTHRDDVEDWVTKRRVWTLMNASLHRPLRRALEFRDEIERASGGFSVLDNLQLLCNLCNGSKGDRTMDYLEHMNAKRKVNIEI